MSTTVKVALILGLGAAAYFVFVRKKSRMYGGRDGRNRHQNFRNGAPRNYNGATPTTVSSAVGAASTVYYGSKPVYVHDSAGDPSSGC